MSLSTIRSVACPKLSRIRDNMIKAATSYVGLQYHNLNAHGRNLLDLESANFCNVALPFPILNWLFLIPSSFEHSPYFLFVTLSL